MVLVRATHRLRVAVKVPGFASKLQNHSKGSEFSDGFTKWYLFNLGNTSLQLFGNSKFAVGKQ